MFKETRFAKWKSLLFGVLLVFAMEACSSAPRISREPSGGVDKASSEPDSLFSDGSKIHESDQGNALGLESVRFQFKSFTLTKEARAIIKRNARILKSYSHLIIQLEGNCDSKGSDEYNFILGEKRAKAVRELLIKEGVPEKQLILISYGKSRPLLAENTEVAQIKNRRTNFSILST